MGCTVLMQALMPPELLKQLAITATQVSLHKTDLLARFLAFSHLRIHFRSSFWQFLIFPRYGEWAKHCWYSCWHIPKHALLPLAGIWWVLQINDETIKSIMNIVWLNAIFLWMIKRWIYYWISRWKMHRLEGLFISKINLELWWNLFISIWIRISWRLPLKHHVL